jgi:hypothetical protein
MKPRDPDKGTCGCIIAILLIILVVDLIWGVRGCVPKPKTISIEVPSSKELRAIKR